MHCNVKSVFDKVCSVYCISCAVCIVQGVQFVLYRVGSLYCTGWAAGRVKNILFPSASPMLSAFGSVKVK